jgi:predicted small secreted protein
VIFGAACFGRHPVTKLLPALGGTHTYFDGGKDRKGKFFMKKRDVVFGLPGILLAASMILTGCENPASGPGGGVTVSALDLSGFVVKPVSGETPVTTAIDAEQYTGTIAWLDASDNELANDTPFGTAVYKAVLTLTAKSGYTFTGLVEDSFTYTGATSVTNAANSGTVTITFPTAAAPVAVTDLNLTGKVTAPVRGAALDTTAIDAGQYTGTIAWQNQDGSAFSGNFAASTVYKAVVTLTKKSGYTFTGVGENSFTHGATTSVTNAANSGTVTITFPATAAEGADSSVTKLDLTSYVTAPVKDAAPVNAAIDTDQYSGTIAWKEDEGDRAVSGNFKANTVYKAVVTLTKKSGYTFSGVGENSFAYTGATSVTNPAGSTETTLTVTITFPATDRVAGNVLVITGITDVLAAQASQGIGIGIFPAGTAPEQALQMTGIVAGALNDGGDDDDITLSDGSEPYTATAELYAFEGGDFPYRWTGSGTYDVYLLLGPETNLSYYFAGNIPFISGGVTSVTEAVFSTLMPSP